MVKYVSGKMVVKVAKDKVANYKVAKDEVRTKGLKDGVKNFTYRYVSEEV